jgi:8-oxo-dGTP pyrophosphatase MutT (NUDIX family)
VPKLSHIREALAAHQPKLLGPPDIRRAAVALVMAGADESPQLLFIERAHHELDPWSGHMAFPGGRVDPQDRDTRFAAERETREEVGVSLGTAEPLGRLDDLEGRHAGRPAGLVISAFAYRLEEPAPLEPNLEVASAFWFPLHELLDPQRHVEYRARASSGAQPYPGILIGEPDRHVVWGLTYRFLEVFFQIVGRPLPDRWGDLRSR